MRTQLDADEDEQRRADKAYEALSKEKWTVLEDRQKE